MYVCILYVCIVFVDFCKAYDKVPRQKLLEQLKLRGCGRVMLSAISAMYKCTKYVLRSAVISASIGVRQGAPTSCLLFTIYIDSLVRRLKAAVGEDGYLGAMHALLLMDDTVIFASSRRKCMQKFEVLLDFCKDTGMEINQKKTKFMVINGMDQDKQVLETQGTQITYTKHYVYLGAHFTDDAKLSSVIREHAKSAMKHVNKFAMFTRKNANMPYSLKKKVLDAALFSAMLYSCETWLTRNIREVTKHYFSAIKLLLGVRTTTTNILCLVETGYPELESLIKKRRMNFIQRFIRNSSGEEPLAHALDLCREANTKTYRMIEDALSSRKDPVEENLVHIKAKCEKSTETSSKVATYLTMNPTLEVHPIYYLPHTILDEKRVEFSRFRLSAHRLKVETGRWTRTPRERRTCSCDSSSLQDERHALLECPLTANIRQKFKITDREDIHDIFRRDGPELCDIIQQTLYKYRYL